MADQPAPRSSPIPPPPPSALRRLAVQPPRLTVPQSTTYAHGQQTPASSTSLSLPFSPFAASSPSTYAASPLPPASPLAMRNTSSVPYNPQQWSRGGSVNGQYAPHPLAQPATRAHDTTGMEGIQSFSFVALCSMRLPTTVPELNFSRYGHDE